MTTGETTTLCLTAHASWGAASHEEAELQGLPHKATPVCPVLSAPPTTVQPVTWYTSTLQLHTHACMHTRMYVVCDNWQSAWETAITKSIQEHTQGRSQASQDLNTKQEETHDLYLSSMHTHTHISSPSLYTWTAWEGSGWTSDGSKNIDIMCETTFPFNTHTHHTQWRVLATLILLHIATCGNINQSQLVVIVFIYIYIYIYIIDVILDSCAINKCMHLHF